MGCTLPRAPEVKARSEGREGHLHGSASGCLAGKTQGPTESTRLPGTLAVVCSPAHPEADSVGAQQLPHTRRFPSALLGAETCAGGWGLPLRVWAHAQSPSSGEQPLTQDLQEALGESRGSPAACGYKPCLGGSECASSTAELQLCSESRSGRVPGARQLCPGPALP